MSQGKILESHLKRQAVIYVRQSSPQQVEENLESQHRQYALVERAQLLGWPAARCVVIDDDLGISAAQSHNRPGYQRLISLMALREVGLVLGLEVSRLARNNLDWYQLLELAAAFDVLIGDEDGLYDPNDFNDRLLLGLKGTISEVELYQIRTRMVRGRLNKAHRGELTWPLPVGLEYDPGTGQIRLAVDESVRHALETVFQLFRQLRSLRGVLNYLHRAGMELPYRHWRRGLGPELGWRPPAYDTLYLMLTNPLYAGVYCYGRRQRQVDPLTHIAHVRWRDRNEWEVFQPNHHPGYLTLAEFEENQRILDNNRNLFPSHQGAPRTGAALLQGLVYCKHCGCKMRIRYHTGQPYYVCDTAHRRFAARICNRASAKRVDALVEELFLSVVNAQTLELSLAYDEKLHREAARIDRAWRDKLQRLEYQADLAHRRYELVDPANRLVARTLETEWEQRLSELASARSEYNQQRTQPTELATTLAEIQYVVSHLHEYWYASTVTDQDKKQLLRCLMEQVFLESQGKVIRAHITWYGGATSELDVPKYLFSPPRIYHRVLDLAHTHTDAEIAEILNQEGTLTAKEKLWSPRHVMDFRRSNAIPSGFTTNPDLRAVDAGYITSAEAASRLEVCQSTIQKWYKLGVLAGKHDGGQAPLWICWTDDIRDRLQGAAIPDPHMVSVRSLCRIHHKRPDDILAWAVANSHPIYRLRRNRTLRFFVLPAEASVPLQ